MCTELDQISLNFSPTSLWWLDITLAIIMFGVALNLKVGDFRATLQRPKAPLMGLVSQLLLLPALTWLLVWVVEPCPSLALGMFLVAACPGGNISNFISLLARANVALSVSLSAISTLLSIVFTPLNFTFWANLYGPTQAMLTQIQMDPVSMFLKILIILALPLVLGMWTAHRYPQVSLRIGRVLRGASIAIFAAYVVMALASNFSTFLTYARYVILLVAGHNALALIAGYTAGRLGRLSEASCRTLSIETGIQNSGVALVLIFGPIFDGLGGMALIAAMWGLWHMVSGLSLATWWAREKATSRSQAPQPENQ
jgi:bile acid:Na+ symporter, BASS family